MSHLARLMRRAILLTVINEGRDGLLGRADGTVVFTDASGAVHRNLVWVRIVTDAATTLVVAENGGVPLQPGLPVKVADRNGVPTVIGVNTRQANIFTGGFLSDVPEHAWTHGRFGPDPLYITGPTFLPLMARPSDPADMTVTVETGFYRYIGVEKVWERAASSSLSAYVPANSLIQHFIIICLDRENNILAVVDGTDKAGLSQQSPFTASEVLAVLLTIADAYYPIAAIRFYAGQTAIKPPDIFMDLRLWGGELFGEAGSSAGFDVNIIMTDGLGNIMVDGLGNVMVET